MFFKRNKPNYRYGDLNTEESQRNDLTAEEFPEGAYGSSIPMLALGKSSPWEEGQESPAPYGYENVSLHAGIPRGYPGEDEQQAITEEGEP